MRFGLHLPTCWDDYGASPIRVAIEEAAQAAEALVCQTLRIASFPSSPGPVARAGRSSRYGASGGMRRNFWTRLAKVSLV